MSTVTALLFAFPTQAQTSCQSAANCGPGETCNPTTHSCEAATSQTPPPPSSTVGTQCETGQSGGCGPGAFCSSNGTCVAGSEGGFTGETGPGLAQNACTADTDCPQDTPLCNPSTKKCEKRKPEPAVGIPSPLGNISVPEIIGRIIKGALGLSGVIALLMFVWGGVNYMIAAGNADKITKARNTLIWASLGLVAIFGAYGIVSAILTTVQKGTAGGAASQSSSSGSSSAPSGGPSRGECELACFNGPADTRGNCFSGCASL